MKRPIMPIIYARWSSDGRFFTVCDVRIDENDIKYIQADVYDALIAACKSALEPGIIDTLDDYIAQSGVIDKLRDALELTKRKPNLIILDDIDEHHETEATAKKKIKSLTNFNLAT